MAKSDGALEKYLAQKDVQKADQQSGKTSVAKKYAQKSQRAKKVAAGAEAETEPKKTPKTSGLMKALGM